jgi:predicted RNA-binding protein with PIN domain
MNEATPLYRSLPETREAIHGLRVEATHLAATVDSLVEGTRGALVALEHELRVASSDGAEQEIRAAGATHLLGQLFEIQTSLERAGR